MALNKNKNFKSITANYWRISQLNMNYDRRDAVIVVSLYKDEAARTADSNNVLKSITINLDGYFHSDEYGNGQDNMKNVSLKQAYKALKHLAILEAAKPEPIFPGQPRNEDLVYFADAVGDV